MAQIPTGRYSRQQIRDLALNRAGNRRLDSDATSWLAQLLFDLYTLYDWPFLNTSAALTVTGPTFPLPTDFQRSQDDGGLWWTSLDGQPLTYARVIELDPMAFDSYTHANLSGLPPQRWLADLSAGVGRVSADPTGHTLTGTLRYKFLPAEPATASEPTDVPVFPWHSYLVQALYVTALEHEKDPRAAQEVMIRDQQFALIRRGSAPRRSQPVTIPLDNTVFRTPWQGN